MVFREVFHAQSEKAVTTKGSRAVPSRVLEGAREDFRRFFEHATPLASHELIVGHAVGSQGFSHRTVKLLSPHSLLAHQSGTDGAHPVRWNAFGERSLGSHARTERRRPSAWSGHAAANAPTASKTRDPNCLTTSGLGRNPASRIARATKNFLKNAGVPR